MFTTVSAAWHLLINPTAAHTLDTTIMVFLGLLTKGLLRFTFCPGHFSYCKIPNDTIVTGILFLNLIIVLLNNLM